MEGIMRLGSHLAHPTLKNVRNCMQCSLSNRLTQTLHLTAQSVSLFNEVRDLIAMRSKKLSDDRYLIVYGSVFFWRVS